MSSAGIVVDFSAKMGPRVKANQRMQETREYLLSALSERPNEWALLGEKMPRNTLWRVATAAEDTAIDIRRSKLGNGMYEVWARLRTDDYLPEGLESLRWMSDIPAARRLRSQHSEHAEQLCDALDNHPGLWTRAVQGFTRAQATRFRKAVQAQGPEYEVTSRRDEDGTYSVYARLQVEGENA